MQRSLLILWVDRELTFSSIFKRNHKKSQIKVNNCFIIDGEQFQAFFNLKHIYNNDRDRRYSFKTIRIQPHHIEVEKSNRKTSRFYSPKFLLISSQKIVW